MLCAAIERFALKDTIRKGALRDYVILAVVTFLGMYLTNWCGWSLWQRTWLVFITVLPAGL
jgi:hypothetical protein